MNRTVVFLLAALGLGYLILGLDLFGIQQRSSAPAEPIVVEQAAPVAASTEPAARPAPVQSAAGAAVAPRPTPAPPPAAQVARPAPALAAAGGPSRREAFVLISPAVLANPMPVNATGEGFLPQEIVEVVLRPEDGGQAIELGDIFADKEGRLAGATVQLPATLDLGRYELEFRGIKSGRLLRGRVQLVQGTPQVQFDLPGLTPYQPFEFSGANFAPGEEIQLFLDSLSSEPFSTLRADARGSFTARNVRAPLASEGDHHLIVVGAQSRTPQRVPVYIQGFHPWIILQDYAPKPQSTIGATGHGFVPGETVQVFFDKQPAPVAELQANDEGDVPGEALFELPVTVKGQSRLVFVGTTSQVPAEATFAVLPFGPSLELTAYAGRPGFPVGFIGSGWARGEPLRAYLGTPSAGREVVRFEADPTGAFQGAGTFRIPYDTKAGRLAVTLVGEQSDARMTVEFLVLPIEPFGELSSYKGPAGVSLTFVAHGFAAGESIAIYLNARQGEPIVRGQATPDGDLPETGGFEIPPNTSESLVFIFVGEQSGVEVKQTYEVE